MIYKMFSLIFFTVLFSGANQINAEDSPCECIVEITAAVTEVVNAETDGWVTPKGLLWQTERLEAICEGTAFPYPAELIMQRMITIVSGILDGTKVCDRWPDEIPEDVKSALESLKNLLIEGCESE